MPFYSLERGDVGAKATKLKGNEMSPQRTWSIHDWCHTAELEQRYEIPWHDETYTTGPPPPRDGNLPCPGSIRPEFGIWNFQILCLRVARRDN